MQSTLILTVIWVEISLQSISSTEDCEASLQLEAHMPLMHRATTQALPLMPACQHPWKVRLAVCSRVRLTLKVLEVSD